MGLYAAVGGLLGWFALALQLYLLISSPARGVAILGTLISYFSFFSILTNILVALIFTAAALRWEGFFGRTSVQAAAVGYMAVVGLVYHLTLRPSGNLQGAQGVADLLLNSVLPVIYLLYWLVFAPRSGLRWINAVAWLSYPGVYLLYVLARGAVTGLYPYSFVNVNALGYGGVLLHAGMLMLIFLGVGWLVVALGRMTQKQSRISFRG